MKYIKAFFARTVYMCMAAENKMIFKFRCSNSRQNARKNPDCFCDRASKLVARFLVFVKYWVRMLAKKLVYIGVFMYIPYVLMNSFIKGGNYPYEATMAYFFIILSVLLGSFINPWIYKFDKKEKKFLELLPVQGFFANRLITGMVGDSISFALALRIFNVGFWRYGMWISVAAVLIRPLGEVITYRIRCSGYGRRGYGSFVGVIMAAAVLLAYVVPCINKTAGMEISFYYGRIFTVICVLVGIVFSGVYVFLDFDSVKAEVLKGN